METGENRPKISEKKIFSYLFGRSWNFKLKTCQQIVILQKVGVILLKG